MKPDSPSALPAWREKPYLTPNEAAAQLMVAPNTLRLWSEKGLLRAQTTAGGHRRFPREEVERFLRERHARRASGDTAAVRRVLIIDDDSAFARYLLSLISGAGGESVAAAIAHDGFEAGHMLHTFRPQIILLDLMMPGLDGFQVCHLIKNEPVTCATRIIAMTGYPTQVNIQRILAAGAEVCLPKPLDDERLLDILGLAPRQPPSDIP
ncbi:MAG: response regulator [Candidatus Nitricoxidivorans perseverans]|uniref:Response regulator n=1 Tax=Candidatus Nitricoxidivorans perseverans TaxID=2975601 RepID=A0AA49IZ31_9PROT|nr:MAG: response regulator [Candidatus Nitricoxidivorans perseverans]